MRTVKCQDEIKNKSLCCPIRPCKYSTNRLSNLYSHGQYKHRENYLEFKQKIRPTATSGTVSSRTSTRTSTSSRSTAAALITSNQVIHPQYKCVARGYFTFTFCLSHLQFMNINFISYTPFDRSNLVWRGGEDHLRHIEIFSPE